MPLSTTAKLFPPLLLCAVGIAAYNFIGDNKSRESHLALMSGTEELKSNVLVTQARLLVNQGAISDLTPTEVRALLDTLSESSLIRTDLGLGLYNKDSGTTAYGAIYHDEFPVDPRSVALAVNEVVKNQRETVGKHIGRVKSSAPAIEPKSEDKSDDVAKAEAIGDSGFKSQLSQSDQFRNEIPITGSAKIIDGEIKLSPEQNERYIQMMNEYLNKRGNGTQSSSSQEPRKHSSMATGSSNESSVQGASSGQSESSAGGLTKAQINVSEMSETNTAVFYKGTILPKAGFDSEGSPVSKSVKADQVKMMLKRIQQAGDGWSIHYPAQGPVKKTIAIFGDPGCPVCRKMHEYIPDLQRAGVDIYYLFYNRQLAPHTVGSPRAEATNRTMQNIWCAADSGRALDEAYMNGGRYNEFTDCSTLGERGKSDFPGNAHYLMGRLINMEGTPYAITDDGEILNGFTTRGSAQPMTYLRRLGL